MRHQRRARTKLDESGHDVLRCGIDMFGDFRGSGGAAVLRNLWHIHGRELLAECAAKDRTVRPAGWWWWGAPVSLRLPYPEVLFATEMRERLVKANVLHGEARAAALKHIAAFKQSGLPMAFFDECNHPGRIPHVPIEVFDQKNRRLRAKRCRQVAK